MLIWVGDKADPRPPPGARARPPSRLSATGNVRKGSDSASLCPDLQLLLNALVLLGLGEALLLVAVVVDVVHLQVGAVRAGVLLAVAVVLQVVVHGGRWGRRGRHHHVQLFLGLDEIVLSFLCLVWISLTE